LNDVAYAYLRARAKSFADAGRGVFFMVTSEPHARIHLVVTLMVVALGAWLRLSAVGWCWIVVAIALVWVAEGFNTALEALADAVHPERHAGIGRAKDVAAGAVLLAAIAAAGIGVLVLGPPLLARLAS
jgi:diacylglycerol kinase (ATP)